MLSAPGANALLMTAAKSELLRRVLSGLTLTRAFLETLPLPLSHRADDLRR